MSAADKDEIVGGLRQNFLFASLTDEELGHLADHVPRQKFAAGDMIVREAEKGDTLFVVLAGGVNVTKANGHFLAYLGPRGFFGEMGLFMENSVRSANCVAAADSSFLVVSKEVLDKFCKQYPSTGLKIFGNIIKTLAERLQATSADLAILMGSTQVKAQSGVSKMVEEARRKKAEEEQKRAEAAAAPAPAPAAAPKVEGTAEKTEKAPLKKATRKKKKA